METGLHFVRHIQSDTLGKEVNRELKYFMKEEGLFIGMPVICAYGYKGER